MTFIEALRNVLSNIAKNSQHYPPPASAALEEIAFNIKKKALEVLSRNKEHHKINAILDDLLSPEFNYRASIAFYFLKYDMKFDEKKALEMIFLAVASENLLDLEMKDELNHIEFVALEQVREILYGEMLSPAHWLMSLQYAYELGLAHWDGEKWSLTKIGREFLKVPAFEASKMLLTLEAVLSKGTPFCMTEEFLRKLCEIAFPNSLQHKISFLAKATETPSDLVRPWTKRLEALGVLKASRESIKMNPYALHILKQILTPLENQLYQRIKSLME